VLMTIASIPLQFIPFLSIVGYGRRGQQSSRSCHQLQTHKPSPPPRAPQPSFALRDFQLSFLSAPHANPRTSPNPEKQPQPPVIPPPQSHQPSPLTSNTPAAPPRTEAAPQSRPQQARQPTKRSAQVGTIEDCRSAQNAALKLWWNCWTQEAGVAERGGQDSSNCSLR
jgi:hypothetical protein